MFYSLEVIFLGRLNIDTKCNPLGNNEMRSAFLQSPVLLTTLSLFDNKRFF